MNSSVPLRLHIFGASGSGTSTLGRALAESLGLFFVDTDDLYWQPTDPPFRKSRDRAARTALLSATLAGHSRWVISGSLCGWGDIVMHDFSLAIFIGTPTPLRIERLDKRERDRFGPRIGPGGDMHAEHGDFIQWAAGYETGPMTERSRLMHETWIKKLVCPVLRVDGSEPVERLFRQVVAALGRR
jgi:adenylate kinase family enzyme